MDVAPGDGELDVGRSVVDDSQEALVLPGYHLLEDISILGKLNLNEYLLTVTGLKKMKWFLSFRRCHFQPRVTQGHKWLEMAPSLK